MKGSYHIRVSNRIISYEFTIHRNITILQGDSATGKTTLVEMIREYETQGTDSAIHLTSEKPCAVIEGNTWKRQLRELDEDTIVFIDEGSRFVSTREFADTAAGSGHYYVIVTREALYELPYSVTEIYGIHSSGKYNSLQPVYHTFYRIYAEQQPDRDMLEKTETVVTEDSQSGFQFFSAICTRRASTGGRKILCRSADGNSNIITLLEEQSSDDKSVLVIADGAAFGAYMQQISLHIRKHRNVFLYLPESFEWLILKSGLVDGNRIKEILSAPENYIESRIYFSWEHFFTELLVKETQKTYLQYQKGKLNAAYLQPREMKAMISALPGSVGELFTDTNPAEDEDI